MAEFVVDDVDDELDITRYIGSLSTADSTTYTTFLVKWGSDWTVQTISWDGSPVGDNLELDSDYYIENLSSTITPKNTWIWSSSYSDGKANASGYNTANFSIGLAKDYLSMGSTDSVGAQNSLTDNITGTSYVMESPNIHVERFIVSETTGSSSTITNGLAPAVSETYTNTGSIQKTVGERLNVYTSSTDNKNTSNLELDVCFFEQLRNTSATTISWSRANTNRLDFIVYSIDFAGGGSGAGEAAALLNQTDYTGEEKGVTAAVMTQTDYVGESVGRAGALLVQVDYGAPEEQNITTSANLQAEIEYTSRHTVGSVNAQVEWEGPPASGDSKIINVGAASSITPTTEANVDGVGAQSAVTPSTEANVDGIGLQSATTPSTLGHLDSIGLNNAVTPVTRAHLDNIYLQIAVTNPQPLAGGDEDIQGERFKKRFKSFYKR
jgi:hypothetical protein